MIKKIYLAGAMGGLTWEEQKEWRRKFSLHISENIIRNYKAFILDPTEYYNFEGEPEYDSQREVMDFDLDLVRGSDIIVVNWNYPDSKGTLCEVAIAYDRGIPVIGICEDGNRNKLHPWQKEMCRKILPDVKITAEYITSFYLV